MRRRGSPRSPEVRPGPIDHMSGGPVSRTFPLNHHYSVFIFFQRFHLAFRKKESICQKHLFFCAFFYTRFTVFSSSCVLVPPDWELGACFLTFFHGISNGSPGSKSMYRFWFLDGPLGSVLVFYRKCASCCPYHALFHKRYGMLQYYLVICHYLLLS